MSLFSLPAVLDLVAKATVILAVTGLVAAALRHASASARHFVWTLGLVSALIAPALSVALPRWELPIVRVAAPAPQVEFRTTLDPAHTDHAAVSARSVAPKGGSDTGAGSADRRAQDRSYAVAVLPSWPALA